MSNPPENKSQNYSQGIKMVISYQNEGLHAKLSRFLRIIVAKTITKLRPPILLSQCQLTENRSDEALAANAAGRGGTRTNRPSFENFLLTFKFPERLANRIDMDKLARPNLEGNGKGGVVREYSFRERLAGWSIERRQRENGKCDMSYLHTKSGRMFRSICEIVNFMLYEINPENPRKRKAPCSDDGKKKEEGNEEEKIIENENELLSSGGEDKIALYERLENEAAEVLITMCDGTQNIKAVSAASSSTADELDLINHVPICRSMQELQEFLINNRKNMQA